MNLDNDIFHVVIRLPYKRPPRFVEPPSIVWTNEMEHKLWQYMSQKNTDWNEIAEQLGVPTSYVVRHAAFIYETQLRGIHQQLRLNTNTTTNIGSGSISRNSPTPSKSSRPASIRYSNTLLHQQESPLTESSISFRTVPEKSKETIHSSTTNQSSATSTATARNRMSHEDPRYFATTPFTDEPVEEDHDKEDTSEEDHAQRREEREEEEEEETFSSHFERMKMQVEEPAFLPHKRHGSTDHSLSNSRQQLSLSIQNLKKINMLETESNKSNNSSNNSSNNPSLPQSPIHPAFHQTHTTYTTVPGSSNASASHSIGSSFSDLSDSSVTQSALEEAFLSKFNQGGSKMSLMNLSRKHL